jgi:hypothetical protein
MNFAFLYIASAFSTLLTSPLIFEGISTETRSPNSDDVVCITRENKTVCELKRASIGDVPIKSAYVYADQKSGRVAQIIVLFEASSNYKLISWLKEAYGKPSTDFRSKAKNKQGMIYDRCNVSWKQFSDGSINLTCFEMQTMLSVQFGKKEVHLQRKSR